MPYHKPDRKELAVLKKIEKLLPRITHWESELSMYASHIMQDKQPGHDQINWLSSIAFAKDGVRCNGVGDATTLADFILAIKRIRRKRSDTEYKIKRAIRELDAILIRMEEAISGWALCPTCDGTKGTGTYHNHTWVDCPTCNGRGVV
jgi:hypothetical protein